jgi:glycosyltransferase involved in cell wall biosynthesis
MTAVSFFRRDWRACLVTDKRVFLDTIELLRNKIEEMHEYADQRDRLIGELRQEIGQRDSTVRQLNEKLEQSDIKIEGLKQDMEQKDAAVRQLIRDHEERIRNLTIDRDDRMRHAEHLENTLRQIYDSRNWKIGQFYGRCIRAVGGNGMEQKLLGFLGTLGGHAKTHVRILREEGIGRYIKYSYRYRKQKVRELLSDEPPVSPQEAAAPAPQYSPYDRMEFLKTLPVSVVTKDELSDVGNVEKISLITTVKNEADNIYDYLESIQNQTLCPDEVVIVDGGSTDSTVKIIRDFAKASHLNIRLFEENCNIARGRNIAIESSVNELILVSDAGCLLEEVWCETMAKALCRFKTADIVGGTYVHENFDWNWDMLDYDRYLPSSRNIAFRKSFFEKTGGYAEWLTLTGEDTLFDIDARRLSRSWVIIKDLAVSWREPITPEQVRSKAFSYCRGDAESGIGFFTYYRDIVRYLKGDKSFSFDPLNAARVQGVIEGFMQRISLLKSKIKGNIVIFSGVPLYDSGGAQRGAQIAIELNKRGYFVTYVNVYPSYEEGIKTYIDLDFSLLELWFIDDFNFEVYRQRFREYQETLVLLEFPHPRFTPFIDIFKKHFEKVCILYDSIDNWESTLGWIWYSIATEKDIIGKSDVLIASAKSLKKRMEEISCRSVSLIPNAVNLQKFDRFKSHERPADLPAGRKVIMYVGALWGQWFDWDLLRLVADSYPEFAVVCIGNYSGECPYSLKNVSFLGLKSHHEVPSYLKYADVCIIPFKIDTITEAVNPLKIYEYLAMGKPVIATYMNEVAGMPFVYLSRDSDEFVANIAKAINTPVDESEIALFIQNNSWESRIDEFLEIITGWAQSS